MTIKWTKVDAIDAVDAIDVRYDVHQSTNGKKGGKARARIAILPGLTEFIEKHQDQIDGFSAMGLDCVTIDWPGQGLSSRMANNHPTVIHIPSYELHLKAIMTVLDEAGFIDPDVPLFIFGHSMGGHLALRLARELEDRHGIKPHGVMLSAPMMMIPVVMRKLTLSLLNLLCSLGLSKVGVPGQQGFSRNKNGFNPMNVLTRDPEGYMVQHHLFEKNPKLRTRGPSFGWVRASLESCIATTTNPEWLKGISVPVQAHLAGNELVVLRGASAPALRHIPQGEIHIYDNARHELMLELPEVRTAIWDRMGQFITDQLNK